MENRSRRKPVMFAAIACLLIAGMTYVPRSSAQTPTFEDVIGRPIAERIALHHEVAAYLQAVAANSDRVRLVEQGRTWEHRTQFAVIISSPENLDRLEEIQTETARLADPRQTPPDAADRLIQGGLPAVGYIGGSIHGFELSGTEAVLRTVERLTTRNDAETQHILQNVVTVFDPMLNPDGRDAFAYYNHQAIGKAPNPMRDDWANNTVSWEALKFRTNHYYFDLNRDWFAHTQVESRNRIQTYVAWNPQFTIDAHEMGSNVEFYFDPATDPWHKYFPSFAFDWLGKFGDAYAAAFDAAGYEYMTRERYNYYFPGYTTSYSSFSGGVGMLFEQGSSRGLALTRFDDSIRRLTDATRHHYLGMVTALKLAADRRAELLQAFYDAKRSALAEGRSGFRRYFLPLDGDAGLTVEAANLLRRNGIEVGRLQQPFTLRNGRDREGRTVSSRAFDAGTFVIEAEQPKGYLVRALLEPNPEFPQTFLKLARERADRAENPRFYDITSWSLPLLFNIPGYSSESARAPAVAPLTAPASSGTDFAHASYGYLLDGRQASAAAALYHLVAGGHRANMLLRDTKIAGEAVASGTVVVRVNDNTASIHDSVASVAGRLGVRVQPIATGQGDAGFVPLGSEHVRPAKLPKIALVAEQPVSGYSFGHAWFALDRQYDIPVTVLRAGRLASTPLGRFNTLVLPHLNAGEMNRLLGDRGKKRLIDWVKDGGTLVAIADAGLFVAKHLELAHVYSWADTAENKDAKNLLPLLTPGAMLRVTFDPEHWLGAGYAGEMPGLVYSNRVLLAKEARTSSRRRVGASFAADASVYIAGHIWEDARQRLADAIFAYEEKHERGRVILLAEDPNFRGFWRGADRLFLNAVLFGVSAP